MKKLFVLVAMLCALNVGAKEITCACKEAEINSSWSVMPAEGFLNLLEALVACPVQDTLRDQLAEFIVAEKELFLGSSKGCSCTDVIVPLFFMSGNVKKTLDAYVKLCKAKNA